MTECGELAITAAPGVELREPRCEADEGRRGGILAAKLAELPLPREQPKRVTQARLEAADQAIAARARFYAVPVGDARLDRRHRPHCVIGESRHLPPSNR